MELEFTGGAFIADYDVAFPRVIEPGFAYTDYAYNLNSFNTSAMTGFKTDPLLSCMYANPIFVPHNQVYSGVLPIADLGLWATGGAGQFVNWTAINVTNTPNLQAFALKPWGTQYFEAHSTNEAQSNQTTLQAIAGGGIAFPGFILILQRMNFYSASTQFIPSSWSVIWTVNSTDYRIIAGVHAHPKLQSSPTGKNTWKDISSRTRNSVAGTVFTGNSTPGQAADQIVIEVFPMNSQMLVSIGATASPIVVTLDTTGFNPGDSQLAYPMCTNVIVNFSNFTQCSWSLHPLKFESTASFTSNEIPLNFYPTANAGMKFMTVEQGYSNQAVSQGGIVENYSQIKASASVVGGGEDAQYTVSIYTPPAGTYNNVNFANTTCAFTRFTVDFPAMFTTPSYNATGIIPKEFTEHISLDLGRLTISHSVDMTVDNWLGITETEQISTLHGYGTQALSLRYGWLNDGPSIIDGGPGYQRFYGFIKSWNFTRPLPSMANLEFTAVDQMQQLQDSIIAAPVDMDGWNHYYAIFYLAQLGGIAPSQLAFINLVPFDPYSTSANDTAPFFLPLGYGLHPWTPRDRTLTVMELMEFVRQVSGYLMYIDAYGFFHYEPFIPPELIPPKRIFMQTASPGDYNEMSGIDLSIDNDDVRNQIILIGIDEYSAAWSPIVVKLEDTASIYGNGAGNPPPLNYIGYKKPFVWMDSRFANVTFANTSAQTLYQIMRLPGMTCTIRGWLQPYIFPMDVVQVVDYKSNAIGTSFYVTDTISTASALGGNNYTYETVLRGRVLL